MDKTATLASLSEYAKSKKAEEIKVLSDHLEYVKMTLNE